jgi:hypothetical protein
MGSLALLGRETLQVFVLHLYLLFGWLFTPTPYVRFLGKLGFLEAFLALLLMLPPLYAAAWLWHRVKAGAPREAQLALGLISIAFVYEFATRPW